MKLEMDIGNSRIKWRTRTEDAVSAEGVAANVSDLLGELERLQSPEEILVSCVRGDVVVGEIAEWAMQQWRLVPKLAYVSAQASGVTNSYSDVSRMGVDRWLAMLAAYHRTQSACLVVDGGTALTIDVINNSGVHLGGYILPGLALAVRAIEENTGIRLQHHEHSPAAELGNNTEAAVLNGELAQIIALIEKVANQLIDNQTDGAETAGVKLLLSGGDANLLQAALADSHSIHVEICPTLVLDGLALAETQDYQ